LQEAAVIRACDIVFIAIDHSI